MTLPVVLRKATPAFGLLGLALVLTGCTPDQDLPQDQFEQSLPAVHSTGTYGQSAIVLPQNLRHYQRAHHPVQNHHHVTPPAEVLAAGY